MKVRLVLAPLVGVMVLQVAGCGSSGGSGQVPPGGTYVSKSAGANFEQSVTVVKRAEDEPETIAGLSLAGAHRPLFSPQRVYVAAGSAGVVASDDGGATWRVWTTPLSSTRDVVALENGVVVVSGLDGEGQGFIIRTIDEGKSWETVLTVPIPVEQRRLLLQGNRQGGQSVVIALAPDPFSSERVFAGTSLGNILLGEQSAKTWRTIHTLSTGPFSSIRRQTQFAIEELVPSPHTPGEVLVVLSSRELWRIREGSEEQLRVRQDLTGDRRIGLEGRPRSVGSAVYVPGFPAGLLVGVEDGAVISRDAGLNWEQLPLPVDTVQDFNSVEVAVSPTNASRILVAINDAVYRSEDGGQSWNTFSLGLSTFKIIDVLIDPSNAANVLLVTTPLGS